MPHEQMSRLIELVRVDKSIHEINEQLELYPKMLADLEAKEQADRRRVEETGAAQAKAREERRKAELDVGLLREKIGKYRMQQGLVKTNREYQAINEEIALVEANIDRMDEAGLEALEAEEKAETDVKSAKERLARLARDAAGERERIAAQVEEKKSELEKLNDERLARLAGVPAELQDDYELLNEKYPGSALAPVVEGCCGVCGMTQVKQALIDVRKPDAIVRCESCSRILHNPSS